MRIQTHLEAHPYAAIAVGLAAAYAFSRIAKKWRSPAADRIAEALGQVLAMAILQRARSQFG